MSALCKWLHRNLVELKLFRYPFFLQELPTDAIYFFYEDGESWGHGGHEQRITRIGTSKDGNFRSRINEHFMINDAWMEFDANRPAPKDRSIFRKNIGRALLNRGRDSYLKVWNIDFTKRINRDSYSYLRDIQKERRTESEITRILRREFGFRFLILDDKIERMGSKGLESSLIGTVSNCHECKASSSWVGNFSSVRKIKEHYLWQVQHLNAPEITAQDKKNILRAIERTKKYIQEESKE